MVLFLKFLEEHPKPTKKDLKQLLPQIQMEEKEVNKNDDCHVMLLYSAKRCFGGSSGNRSLEKSAQG